ncbi:hypothetical protein [Pedobacter rhodius]|uniref:Uncharacterized protein n=1 Tax=Pedobacter rhodius TaxID=3004098 RepID=A0ABT4KYJ4_9SPHI|nr:hypothetical protein [Pedobacter sp. SJ11]MCZ4224002.1 hypothetical protein [Pedobacter sp. SJ11]
MENKIFKLTVRKVFIFKRNFSKLPMKSTEPTTTMVTTTLTGYPPYQ